LTLTAGGTAGWEGNKLIIGEFFAKKLNINAGDFITLEIGGAPCEYMVAGVAQSGGLFLRDAADGGYLLTPPDGLTEISGGNVNLLFIKLHNPNEINQMRDRIAEALPMYEARIGVDHAIIRAETDNYVLPFRFACFAVIFMSIFIIYSSFNLIVIERIGVLGILRSVGCTRGKTNRILLLESAVIGFAGGAAGCVLGIGILHLIKNIYFSGGGAALSASPEAPVVLGSWPFIFTLAMSSAITAASAMYPILRTTREQIKNIILNDFQKKINKDAKLWPAGLILLAPCVIAPRVAANNLGGMALASLSAVIALVGVNLCIPKLCACCSILIRKLPLDYEISLGVRNTGDFRQLVNNIRLLASTIALMIFMATMFNTLGTDLRESYRRENYDIIVELRDTGKDALLALSQTEGVKDFYGVYETYARLTSHGTFMNAVVGLENTDFFSYSPASIPPENQAALAALDDGRNIVTTTILRDKFGLRLGDTMTIQFENGPASYTITGFVDTNWGIGHVGYISANAFIADAAIDNYSKLFVRAQGDPGAVKGNILRSLSRDVLSAQTKNELEAANADKVIGIFNAINTYAYFAMLVGLIGIINNIVACFLSRRRNLALYRCIGMSSAQTGRMLRTEAAAIGVIGVAAGLPTGLLMTLNVPVAVGMLWGNVAMRLPAGQIAALCMAGVAAMLLASGIPSALGKNASIMDALRYE
jgi:putative ABC transport system permease protein